MSRSGVKVDPKCVEEFNKLKLGKTIKFIIYKMDNDMDPKSIEIEEASEDTDWEVFRQKLVNAKSENKKTGKTTKGARYAVYDFSYDLPNGEGSRSKITFIAWSPDDAGIKAKMIYSSSKDSLKRSLNGVATELQANDEDDIEYQTVLSKIAK